MKLWKKALTVTLAASLSVTGLPAWGESTQAATADAKKKAESKFVTNVSKDINKEEKEAYKEGEAIVLYRNTKSNVKVFSKKNVFGGDITIESSCDFSSNSVKKGGVSTQSTSKSKDNFTISLVKSDKLSTKQLLAKLKQDKNVVKAEPNYIMHVNETGDYSKYLWALDNKGQNAGTAGEDVKRNSLKDKKFSSDEQVIAIADTGVNYENDDLKNVIWNNPFTDIIKGKHGYDFVNMDDDPMDDDGHGSHCAGIVAGENNGKGITGVAADTNTKIMALKWLDGDGYGEIYDVINAYNYVYQMQQLGVNVVAVNNSWGGEVDSIYGEAAILLDVMNLVGENGALSVCAAGNESENLDTQTAISIPASYDSDYIVTVAASQEDSELADFSCYGKETVDLAAPGANILSPVVTDTFNPTIYENKDALCSYYNNFDEGFDERNVEKLWETVTGGAFVYNAINDGEGEAGITADKTNFFGEKTEKSASLKWSVKNAKSGDQYYLCIPYNAEKSDTPTYHSWMIQEDAPDIDYISFFEPTSTMMIYDFPVASGSAFDVESAVTTADSTWENFLGGLYVYGKENYWSHLAYQVSSKTKKAGQRLEVFKLTIAKEGDYTLYLDDYGISKENVESKDFGQYDFYNGTSMAAPYVSGAVSVLKGLYPNENVLQTRARLIGSTTKKEALKGKVATDGLLDLSKATNPNPVITGGSIDEKGVVTVEGSSFGSNPTLKVNGIQVTPISNTDTQVKFQGEENTTLNVEISRGDLTSTKSLLFINGTEIKKKGVAENDINGDGNLISDGDKLYYVAPSGEITVYDVNNESAYMVAELAGYEEDAKLPVMSSYYLGYAFDPSELFKDEVKNLSSYGYFSFSSPVAHSKEIYTTLRLYLGYTQTDILVKFDVEKGEWQRVTEIPKEFRNCGGVTMASYKGKIYLIGGYDTENTKAISTVYSYDTQKNTWTKEADMPGGRFYAKAVQTNGKLVLTLGGNGKEGSSENYIFDGTNWTVGAKLEGVLDTSQTYVQIPYQEGMETGDDVVVDTFWEQAYRLIPYYEGTVGVTDEGLIYTGIRVEKLGNTFTYDISKNSYVSTGKMLTTNKSTDKVYGGTIGKKFYILSGANNGSYDEYDYDDYSQAKGRTKSLLKNVQQGGADYGFEDTDMEDLLYISAETVKHSTINIVQTKEFEEGYIQGVGKYDIGDTIKLTAIPYDGYFIKDLYVNGKKVKNGYTVQATEKLDGMKVKATFGKYVTSIDLSSSINLVEGESTTLKASVYPLAADNKKLTWSSTDTSVVTVDQNGKVTAKKGAAGECATIKVTAKDRGKICAYCKVQVEAKVPVTKVQISAGKKTIKAGKTLKLTAKVTPTDASNKSVTWKSSKTKYATVSSKGVVKAKKAGKGKTVTITATSVSNPKIKGTIKIKIKK